MQFTVVTGLSGAGKTQVMRFLEDAGFFCIDNLPPVIIPQLATMFISINGKYDNVAFAIDSRVGDMISELLDNLKILKENGYEYKLLFVDARDEVLVKRYKETRRHHPISSDLGLLDSIKKERAMLSKIYQEADTVIDTSDFSLEQLSKKLRSIYFEGNHSEFQINIMSFGFKYGIPLDADLVFDVRCFPNPFYVDELKDKTGNDKEVRDYVMNTKAPKEFMNKLTDMIKFLLPLYIEEGKSSLTIGIGCTGGKHRSVTMANELSQAIENYNKNLIHRDILRGK
ncbi:MAG TPA: RNase adapter RapZ [Clostridiales bacterium]|nr:RNase adapter RapZ [Clostridiales bacterium]